jgi:YD repeat-containing protein
VEGSRKASRVRDVLLFTVVFLVCTAATVFAADLPAPDAGGEAPPSSSVEERIDLPDALDVRQGIEAAEADEAERERWLQSPEAVRQREESRFAFADLDASEAKELLLTVFAKELATLNNDPARWLSGATIVDQHDPTAAMVSREGKTLLLDADVPLRAPDMRGESRKLDLGLEGRPGAFEPVNALTELRIPDEAGGRLAIGSEGLAVSGLAIDGTRKAQPLGEMNLIYPDVLGEAADTDRIVSPTALGVEIFDLLRSADSPETVRFELDLPQGSELRSDGYGGAVVAREDEQIASIPFPHAIDAQGTVVPVELEVQGEAISLTIAHREADLAYPILLDPAIVNDWYNYSWSNGHNYQVLTNGTWNANGNTGWIQTGTSCFASCFWASGRGLYVGMQSGNHSPNSYAQWLFTSRNSSSYIAGAWINPFKRDDHNCGGYSQPSDYAGMWHNGAWSDGPVHNQAKTYGYTTFDDWGTALVIGMGTGGGVNIPCRRDLGVGGTAIWEDDWQDPVLDSVSGIPSGWFGDAEPVSVSVQSHDDGLGIQFVTVTQTGKGVIDQDQVGCTGLVNSRCPNTRDSQFNFTADSLGEGVRTSFVAAQDPLEKGSGSYEITTRADRSSPEVILDGQLAQATDADAGEEAAGEEIEELSLPVYNLEIEATDGNPFGEPKYKRSGVEAIEIYLDGDETPVQSWQQPCSGPDYSCPMTRSYQLELSKIVTTAGEHTLKVIVRDQVGNARERNIEFEYFPATGMKDSYVMHYFPLPDGQGAEEEEEHPTRPGLAVNVMNGNLVYRQRDIDVEGPAVDLEVERYYNSQLPEGEDTEWGDGWTLAQTPDLNPEEGASPTEAELLDTSGALEAEVDLPVEAGEESFDSELQATLTKKSSGGYELTDETGEEATSVAFDETGQTEARLTEGYAKVDYGYEEGNLSEIAVIDPATFSADPSELEIPGSGPIDKPTYDSSFGSYGGPSGQFRAPGDVAIDFQGNLWVADKANHRIQKFDPEGNFLMAVGDSAGSADGQFNRPSSVAIDPAGDILVADSNNHRIQKLSPEGDFISKFGSYGSGEGQLDRPEEVVVDLAGDIWVADTYNGRVQEFNEEGEFLNAADSGQLYEPTGMDIDPSGNVWVSDWQQSRISIFDAEGQFKSNVGSYGSGEGQFNHADAIEIDNQGNVWVGDAFNHRVQRLDLTGAYVDQFGSAGSGDGQLSLDFPMGIATDSEGHLWVTDVNNHRIQRWLVPIDKPTYDSSFGSYGGPSGQFRAPGDVAIDFQGNLWVADKANHRIQKFDPEGNFLMAVGDSAGSADGQFNRPSSVAIDPAGDILVADSNNHRIQKLSPEGDFISKFGSYGSGEGQLDRPEEVVVDLAGDIWVADTYNGRVQEFNEEGEFLNAADSGQLYEPTGMDIDPSGNVWVSDWQQSRISIFDAEGQFKSNVGSYGSGEGQFNHADAIEIDNQGNVWVGDAFNHRVQRLDLTGAYVDQFGSAGSGDGQLSLDFPMGIATDSEGHLWVTDVNNHRIQRWLVAHYELAEPVEIDLTDGDPSVDIETEADLVAGITGNAAGEHNYEHEGTLLVSHEGPTGETTYEYDEADRLSKVTLANGTWGEIDYYADGRVNEVTVDPEGEDPAKSSHFIYKDDTPRRTTVEPSDAPHVVYEIGADGSVLKWWNTEEPPDLDLAGTLYDNREDDGGLIAGDHWLEAQAYSPEGIASIEVIANGNILVDEKYCEQDLEQEGLECVNPPLINEWVTETGGHAPGHLTLEVIATDRIGQSSSERFWVDIPETPPLAPGTPVPPKFSEIAKFREEYGLEVVFPVQNEIELNERIFDLITAWWNPHTPMGEVARASYGRWGIPLRPEDIAELEYREWLYDVNAEKIDQWVEATSPSSYAGYYLDHAGGGIMHIGFLGNQEEQLANLESSLSLMGGSRLSVYPTPPTTSYLSVRATTQSVMDAIESNSTLADLVVSVEDDEAGRATRVGTPNVAQVESILDEMLGANAPVAVEYEAGGGALLEGRYRNEGRMRAGDYINGTAYTPGGVAAGDRRCTAGFGAEDRRPRSNGGEIIRLFLLTAGHCYTKTEQEVWRAPQDESQGFDDAGKSEVGRLRRNALQYAELGGVRTDGAAIRIKQGGIVPRAIWGWDGHALPTKPAGKARKRNTVCYSGAISKNVSCGKIVARSTRWTDTDEPYNLAGYWVRFPEGRRPVSGDSGSPVWNLRTGASIGLVSAGRPEGSFEETLVAPLLHPPNMPANLVPGILHHLGMEPLRLKLGG